MNPLWFEAAVCEDDFMWFVSGIGAGLFKINLKDFQVTYIGKIPVENPHDSRLTICLASVDNYIIGAPFMGKEFWSYNILDDSFQILYELKNSNTFYTYVQSDTSIFFVARDYAKIAEYDKSTKKIHLHDFESKRYSIRQSINTNIFFTGNTCIYNEKLYIAVYHSNYLLEFDITGKTFEFVTIKGAEEDFYGLTEYKGEFLIAAAGTAKIYKWNIESGQLKIMTSFPKDYVDTKKEDFFRFIVGKDYVLLYPYSSNMILKIDGDLIYQISEKIEDFENSGKGAFYFVISANAYEVYALRIFDNTLMKYNALDGTVENVSLIYNKNELERYENDILYRQSWNVIIKEEETVFGLKSFIKHLEGKEKPMNKGSQQSSGKLIAEEIMKVVKSR